MKIRVAFLSVALLLCLSASAQKMKGPPAYLSDNNLKNILYNGWALTYSPSALVNSFPGIQFGLEKSLDTNQFLEFEAAYLLKTSGGSNLYKSGFRFKLGYKLIKEEDILLSAVIYFRKTFHQYREEVIRQAEFVQEIEYSKTKTLIGPTMGIGRNSALSDRLSLQTSFLFGPGIYKVRVYDYPEDAEQIRLRLFQGYSNEGDYFYPIIGVSFKIVYRLGLR